MADGGIAHAMWTQLRSDISYDDHFVIYENNLGLPTRRVDFSARYIGEIVWTGPVAPSLDDADPSVGRCNAHNPSENDVTLVVRRYDANGDFAGYVDTATATPYPIPLDTAWTLGDIGLGMGARQPGMPHPEPLPAPSVLRGPSTTIRINLPLSAYRYVYFLENEGGDRITPEFEQPAGTVAQTPNAAFDFATETLVGFEGGGVYSIDGGEPITATGLTPSFAIDNAWFGGNISIVRVGDATHFDSVAQILAIPARPAAPIGVDRTNETAIGANDGSITGVSNLMQYSADNGVTWKNFILEGGQDSVLVPPGTYLVRFRATSSAFASANATVVVNAYGGGLPEEIRFVSVSPAVNGDIVTVYLNRDLRNNEIVIIAVYDGDILLAVRIVTTSSMIGPPPVSFTAAATFGGIPSNADTIRVMLWNSIDNMQPLDGAITATQW